MPRSETRRPSETGRPSETRRGVLYMIWGDQVRGEMEQSIDSVRRFGLEHHVHELPADARLTDKARMAQCSPFDETLFLDTDTVLLDDPSFGFDMAARHGLALAMAPACWAHRQWQEEPDARPVGRDLVEYNTGVVFFDRNDAARALFRRWCEITDDHGWCDQWAFAQAVDDRAFNPFVLQPNWNVRASPDKTPIYGPIKVWHSREPVPENVAEWNSGPIRWGRIDGRRIVEI